MSIFLLMSIEQGRERSRKHSIRPPPDELLGLGYGKDLISYGSVAVVAQRSHAPSKADLLLIGQEDFLEHQHAALFEQIHQSSSPGEPDPELALEHRRRPELGGDDELDRLQQDVDAIDPDNVDPDFAATMVRKNLMAELPFMATENILMACAKAGGDRQQYHEIIRRHAQAAGMRAVHS